MQNNRIPRVKCFLAVLTPLLGGDWVFVDEMR